MKHARPVRHWRKVLTNAGRRLRLVNPFINRKKNYGFRPISEPVLAKRVSYFTEVNPVAQRGMFFQKSAKQKAVERRAQMEEIQRKVLALEAEKKHEPYMVSRRFGAFWEGWQDHNRTSRYLQDLERTGDAIKKERVGEVLSDLGLGKYNDRLGVFEVRPFNAPKGRSFGMAAWGNTQERLDFQKKLDRVAKDNDESEIRETSEVLNMLDLGYFDPSRRKFVLENKIVDKKPVKTTVVEVPMFKEVIKPKKHSKFENVDVAQFRPPGW